MGIKRRTPKSRVAELSAVARRFFMDEIRDDDRVLHVWESFMLRYDHPDSQTGLTPLELWGEHEDEILEAFIKKHPGKRPTFFWAQIANDRRENEGKLAYLKRKKLLTAAEIQYLKKAKTDDE